jgi:DNA-binding FrmR family transcriptional regulator
VNEYNWRNCTHFFTCFYEKWWIISLVLYLIGYIIVIVAGTNEPTGGVFMEYNSQVKNRIKRVEGQLRGIVRMMEQGEDCKDVITQLSAAKTALDRSVGLIVSMNLVECVRDSQETGENTEDLVKEAVNLLVKSR